MWQVLAERFRGHPAVIGYDLINEPMGELREGEDLPAAARRIEAQHAPSPRGRRASWRGRCGSPSGAATASSARSTVLLALTAAPGVVADVLAEHGATYATVHRALYGPEADGQGHAKAG
ncbi:hypothetical protein SMICM17S_10928 [Streptomyces microflavus]